MVSNTGLVVVVVTVLVWIQSVAPPRAQTQTGARGLSLLPPRDHYQNNAITVAWSVCDTSEEAGRDGIPRDGIVKERQSRGWREGRVDGRGGVFRSGRGNERERGRFELWLG